ncbi:MAG: AI-2E family transporter [Thermoanaerobaculia bacterium]
MVLHAADGNRTGELELFARKVIVVVAFALALILLWAVRDVLILVFIAAILAAGISPAVHRVRLLGRFWFHRNIPRGTAALIVYFPFLILVLSLAIFLVPRLVTEMHSLGAQLPALIETNIVAPLERYLPMGPVREYLGKGLVVPRTHVFIYVKSAATVIASFIAVLFMIVYMLIDATRLRNFFLLLYPPEVRADRRRMLSRMGRRMSSWLSAQIILSAIIGVATFAGLLILRIPFALPLAILATIGEMVPVIGPIVGTAPALAIAILHSRWQFWSVLVMVLVLQKLENLFIAPRVMSRKVSISPLAVFIAFMVGASLLGILGAILAVPVAAMVQVTFEEAFVARRERRQDQERAGTLRRRVH